MLNYLSSSDGVDPALSSSARQFMLCRSFVTEVSKLQRDGGSEEEVAAVLRKYRDRHRHPHNLGPNEMGTGRMIKHYQVMAYYMVLHPAHAGSSLVMSF